MSFIKPLKNFVVTSLLVASAVASAKIIDSSLQQQFETVLDGAIYFNQNTTFEKWHTSPANFHGVFERILNDLDLAKNISVCDALEKRTTEEIALMAEEIAEPEFAPLFASCKKNLDGRLNKFWEQQKIELAMAFPPIIKASQQTYPNTRVQKIDNKRGGILFAAEDYLAENEVVFTFDDGTLPETTGPILKTLKEYNVKAMWFPVGQATNRSQASKEMLKQVAAGGHPIGNHSYTHPGFRKLLQTQGRDAVVAEIARTHQTVFDLTGSVMPFFRFPGGTYTPELQQILTDNRLINWHWNMDSLDFATPNPADIVRNVIAKFEKHRRGILLFHDIKKQTALALPTIMRELLSRGVKPVIMVPEDMNETINSPLVKKPTPAPRSRYN